MPNKVFGEKEKLIVCFTTFKNDPFPKYVFNCNREVS